MKLTKAVIEEMVKKALNENYGYQSAGMPSMGGEEQEELEEGEYDEVMGEAEGDTIIPPARTGMNRLKKKVRKAVDNMGIGSKLKKAAAIGGTALALGGLGYGAAKALETSPEEMQQIAYNYAEKNSDKFEGHSVEEIAKAISDLPEWAKDLEGDELDTEISRQLGDLEPLPYGEEEPVIRESKLYVSATTIDRMISEELKKVLMSEAHLNLKG